MWKKKNSNVTLRNVFKTLYYIEETHESSEGETINQSIDTSTLGLNNGGDIETYEDEYIRMTFEKGEATTSPKYYTEGGYRFYNDNRILLWTKENVNLDYIRFINSSSRYMMNLEYVSGTEFSSIDYNENTAVTTLSYDNIPVTQSAFVITNHSGDYTQCRVPSFEYRVVTEDTEYKVVVVYDDTPNMLYPISRVLEDYDECNGDSYIDELFKRIYVLYSDWNIYHYNKVKDDYEEQWNKWTQTFAGIFMSTKERYESLLNLYGTERESLLSPLKTTRGATSSSTTKGKFSDTPQTSNETGSLEEDKYISEFTKNENEGKSNETTEVDPATIMARLDEIDRLYRNLWRDWVNEFKGLFYPNLIGDEEDDDE